MNNNICENCIELKKEIDVLNARITCVEYDNEELKKENYIKIKNFYIIYNKNKSKIYFY